MNTGAFNVYGYLFATRFDHIIAYRVISMDQMFNVYKGKLDNIMQSFPDEMLWHVASSFSDALRYIIQDLRSIEIESGIYPGLETGDLPVVYLPIVAAIEEGVEASTLPSATFLGNAAKYKDPIGVQNFLDSFGYGHVKTLAPEIYVLSDYVLEEK